MSKQGLILADPAQHIYWIYPFPPPAFCIYLKIPIIDNMLISIITATFNSEAFIKGAIQSLNQQSYPWVEHLIMDGASTDRTLAIIEEEQTPKQRFFSSKDRGIYDALNKGIAQAKGEVIGILHSDDLFASAEVLQKVAGLFQADDTLMAVYGDLQYVDRKNIHKVIRHWQAGTFQQGDFLWGWMPPHPTLFIRKVCFEQFGNYNLQFTSAADYELILRFLYQHQIKTIYIPEVLVKMRVGGLSNKSINNRWKANIEDRNAMKKNGIPFPYLTAVLKPLRKINQYWHKNI